MPKVVYTTSKGLFQETGSSPASLASGIAIGAQSLTAAGSDQTDTTPIIAADGGLVLVSGADGTKGVILPALSSVPAGTAYYILNLDSGNNLEVFPAVGDQIHPTGSDNAAITVAANGMLICVADSAGTLWASAEPAATGA